VNMLLCLTKPGKRVAFEALITLLPLHPPTPYRPTTNMTLFSYLDLSNANRIGLSVHDPFAIFAFACLCSILLLLILLLACTSRRSADEIWKSTHLSWGRDHHDPAYKRHRKSVWSLSSGSGASRRGSVGASLLPLSRGENSVSLVEGAEGLGGLGVVEGEVEMMFSPQAVCGRFLDSQARVVEGLDWRLPA